MIQVKKTLYVTEEGLYLHCSNSSIEVRKDEELVTRIPATAIEQIVFLNNTTISSYLIKWCNDNSIKVSYVSNYGQYYGRVEGSISGNVLLRKEQYSMLDSDKALKLVQNILLGKFLNSISMLNSMIKNSNHDDREKLLNSINRIKEVSKDLYKLKDIDSLRGLEGQVAAIYYYAFDNMLKTKNKKMLFVERSRRPAENNVNAVLNLLYTLLTRDCVAALESNGLDSYCGYLHALRSGRESLACDLVEEFRTAIVDRFVIKNINLSKITEKDFSHESGNILLSEEGRKKILKLWSEYKEEKVKYPFDGKEYQIKLLPYLQARLMAEYIRGDIEEYPPWSF